MNNTIGDRLEGEFGDINNNDEKTDMSQSQDDSQSNDNVETKLEDNVSKMPDDVEDSEEKEYIPDSEYTPTPGKLWGLKRVYEGDPTHGTVRTVPPSELGIPAQKFHEEMGKPEAEELVKSLYDDEDSPFDPVDRPLGLLNDQGHFAGSERHKLEMRAEELGVTVEQLDSLLDGVDLSSL